MIFFVDSPTSPDRLSSADFTMLWEHYHASKFLYPAKLERLQPLLSRIQEGWPLLMNAPAELFQIHLAGAAGRIISSVCAFRDSPDTFVIQHAVSQQHPLRMIDCLQSTTTAVSASSARFAAMFFRLENRWPIRLMRAIGERYSPEHVDLRTQDYLVCRPFSNGTHAATTQDFGNAFPPEAVEIAVAALGELRAASYGADSGSDGFQRLRDACSHRSLLRDRRIFGVFRDNALAGFACCYMTGVPMNFSSLCGRVEFVLHPNSPDRASVVSELARAAIHSAHSRGEQLLPALVDPSDSPAAASAGFTATDKQYSNFLWTREGARGFASTSIALSHWYGRIERISATNGT